MPWLLDPCQLVWQVKEFGRLKGAAVAAQTASPASKLAGVEEEKVLLLLAAQTASPARQASRGRPTPNSRGTPSNDGVSQRLRYAGAIRGGPHAANHARPHQLCFRSSSGTRTARR